MSHIVNAIDTYKNKNTYLGKRIKTLLGHTYSITNITLTLRNNIAFHLGVDKVWTINRDQKVYLTDDKVNWEGNWTIRRKCSVG